MPGPGGSKKTPWPWILGGCGGCLVLIIIGMVVAFAVMVPTARKIIHQSQTLNSRTRAGGFVLFTNELANTPASLKPYYSWFSFEYPSKFTVVPDEENFIKLEEKGDDGSVLENLAVGHITVPAGTNNDDAYPELMQRLSDQLGRGFQIYRELDRVPETVDGVQGLGMHWQATITNTPKGDVQFYGRVILVRKPDQEKGVAIIMIATSFDEDVENAHDVGVKGDLAGILASFRLE